MTFPFCARRSSFWAISSNHALSNIALRLRIKVVVAHSEPEAEGSRVTGKAAPSMAVSSIE